MTPTDRFTMFIILYIIYLTIDCGLKYLNREVLHVYALYSLYAGIIYYIVYTLQYYYAQRIVQNVAGLMLADSVNRIIEK